jgi:16S rRNA (guanine527-N7)-methyltransferase
VTAYDRFIELLLASPVRLTAVPPEAAYERHVDDALAGAGAIAAEAGALIDVGSGTGVPGMVLAIADPARDVVLLEANGRKAAALAGMAAELGLGNVRVVAARAEAAARGADRDAYGVAVCRALARPPVAVELCLPFVRPGGALLLWLGDAPSSTFEAAARALEAELEAEIAYTDGTARRIVVIRKLGPTPARFPRRDGMAAKRPLPG